MRCARCRYDSLAQKKALNRRTSIKTRTTRVSIFPAELLRGRSGAGSANVYSTRTFRKQVHESLSLPLEPTGTAARLDAKKGLQKIMASFEPIALSSPLLHVCCHGADCRERKENART